MDGWMDDGMRGWILPSSVDCLMHACIHASMHPPPPSFLYELHHAWILHSSILPSIQASPSFIIHGLSHQAILSSILSSHPSMHASPSFFHSWTVSSTQPSIHSIIHGLYHHPYIYRFLPFMDCLIHPSIHPLMTE